MDYSGQRSGPVSAWAFLAIAGADLRALFRSRITYAWVLAAIFIQVIRVFGSSGVGEVSEVVPSGLGDFVYFWALVIIGLSASSVSSEAGELADSIMSKSVTRLDYVLAKFVSRLAYTLLTFAVVTAVLVSLSLRLDVGAYSDLGLAAAILVVALTLAMLTLLGVALSIVLSNTVIAIIVLLVVWYAMSLFLPSAGLEVLSPSYVIGRLPDVVAGAWSWKDWEAVLSFLGVSAAAMALSSAYFYEKDI